MYITNCRLCLHSWSHIILGAVSKIQVQLLVSSSGVSCATSITSTVQYVPLDGISVKQHIHGVCRHMYKLYLEISCLMQ